MALLARPGSLEPPVAARERQADTQTDKGAYIQGDRHTAGR
jgi:hypothetical protein